VNLPPGGGTNSLKPGGGPQIGGGHLIPPFKEESPPRGGAPKTIQVKNPKGGATTKMRGPAGEKTTHVWGDMETQSH